MEISINYLLNTVSQTALSYGGKLKSTIQKNKIMVVVLLALGCLAAYLYKRNNNSQSAQLEAKTPQPINTDRTEEKINTDRTEEKTPAAKTQNVFLQAISQDEKHREDELVAIQENQEENKIPLLKLPSPRPSSSPLPSPKEDEKGVLDEEETLLNSDPAHEPIEEDPVELQRKLMEQQDNRRKLISDRVKTGQIGINYLEQHIETTDDLIHFLNEKSSFASAEAIRRNDPDYLRSDFFIFNTIPGRKLEEKFNISLVEFAVRHVKARMNRMYLAHAFYKSDVSILSTSLTKDEIIDFLKDIEGSDLHRQYGASFVNLRQYSSPFLVKVLDSIFPGTGEVGPHAANFKEKNTKGIAIFKEFFADGVVKSKTKFNELFINCLKDHNPELLQALFDLGYQDPVLSVATEELELEKRTQNQKANIINKNRQRQKELLKYLKNRNLKAGQLSKPSTYNDYDRLKETIHLLIKNNFLKLETFGVKTSHDLIIQEFRPDNFVVLHMLESQQCDLQILNSLARTYECQLRREFMCIMDRAVKALDNPNQFQDSQVACQFLHDHYSDLEDGMRQALEEVLQHPDFQSVKQRYFDDLGL